MTDFRALCTELADSLDAETGYTTRSGMRITLDVVVRARVALGLAKPQPLADGDVTTLVGCLHDLARADLLSDETADILTRAANILSRLAPQPVPISKRLPVLEDCDGEGRCWAWRNFDPADDDDGEFWQMIPAKWLPVGGGWTHWLPAHVLPLPSPAGGSHD